MARKIKDYYKQHEWNKKSIAWSLKKKNTEFNS